jgi:hypothetical protein
MATNNRLLEIAYRYRGLDYLVADASGNLYLIPHFRFRRTIYFKKLEPFQNGINNKPTIKYHGTNVSFKQLKERKIKVNETITVYWMNGKI